MRDLGLVGEVGDHALQVAVKEQCLALVGTVLEHRVLEVQQKLEPAKVSLEILSFVSLPRTLFLDEGSWSSWGSWGSCSTSCGQGTISRLRGHDAGAPCSGSATETNSCQGILDIGWRFDFLLII